MEGKEVTELGGTMAVVVKVDMDIIEDIEMEEGRTIGMSKVLMERLCMCISPTSLRTNSVSILQKPQGNSSSK